MEGSWLRVPGAGYTFRRQKQRNSDRRMGWITQEKGTRDKLCLGGIVFYSLKLAGHREVPVLWKLRQKDCKFKASLSYISRSCFKKKGRKKEIKGWDVTQWSTVLV